MYVCVCRREEKSAWVCVREATNENVTILRKEEKKRGRERKSLVLMDAKMG